ncbi:MAG TPA: TRAP transporter substrate-binding protein [Ureibacillus sp.]|nr:TRAP transporter substrate-binding protein [Ureibacillus sp.]
MKRKWLVMVIAIATLILAACGGGSSSGSSNEKVTLSFSHFWPSHHIVQTNVIEKMGEELSAATNGNLTIEIFPAGQLGNPDEQYNLAANGTADIALSVHGYTAGKFPLSSVSDLPFMAESSEEGSEIIQQLYEEFDDLQAEHKDTTPLWLFTGEPNQILSAKKEIKTIEDLKGMKVRSPSPMMSQMLEAVGAVPVSMPVNDIYESLNKGVIDAAMAGLSTINDMKLYEVVDYVTLTNVSTSSMFVVMNTDVYEKLSDENKKALLAFAENGPKLTGQAMDEASQQGIDKANEEGITIYEPDANEIQRWREATKPVVDSWIADMKSKGLDGQAIYDRAVELSGK